MLETKVSGFRRIVLGDPDPDLLPKAQLAHSSTPNHHPSQGLHQQDGHRNRFRTLPGRGSVLSLYVCSPSLPHSALLPQRNSQKEP